MLKSRAVFPIPVMDQVLPGSQAAPLLHGDIARHLHHPRCRGMGRHARDMDLPASQVDEKQYVVCYQATQRPHLGREEVRRDQEIEVRTDKLLPRRGHLAFWRRWDTVTLEDVPHRLVADRIAQVGEGAHDAVVAPGAILPCYADNQRFELLVDFGTAWRLALLRAVKLLSDQFAVPGEDGGGFDNGGDLRQRLLPQLFPDLGQGLALCIGKK